MHHGNTDEKFHVPDYQQPCHKTWNHQLERKDFFLLKIHINMVDYSPSSLNEQHVWKLKYSNIQFAPIITWMKFMSKDIH